MSGYAALGCRLRPGHLSARAGHCVTAGAGRRDHSAVARVPAAADGHLRRGGASQDLIAGLDALAARPGYQVMYSVGWELGKREKAAITADPAQAWQIAVDERGEVRQRAPTAPAATRAAPTASAGPNKPTSPS